VVSWKAGVVLLAVLAALAAYLVVSRPQPAPARASLVPCDVVKAVYFRVQGPSRTVELRRDTPTSPWRLIQPVAGEVDHNAVTTLVNALDVIKVQNTIAKPEAATAYGLDQPREVVTCRVKDGSSYTLSVGSQSFDGSGYYARKGGDNRVYVISSVEVQQFDQALAKPPVKPTPSP
jgi:uncharacterized protein DUF4340